ncbi:hypothetical protein KFZ70_00450 [Tamlana fucoidanivorans]|uniref:Uncharacterized protein n=1 Tax=Allotamlana fucoidanivorans TaxID=2583814 RepID=A0A5C4SIU2_9FLAO|nr:hypothetical protein [Tamlana fucoidanivorans]TNJ43596.1 hypothetical protein FGF67_11845 [Tamlana fucoidanivorans]
MTVINSIFSVSLSLIFVFINLNSGIKTSEIQNKTLTEKIDCGIESVTLKTERIEKKRKFLFWTLKHKKVIVTDRIIDQNGNEVFEKKSVFISSMDASDTRKFNRIKIVGNEIWIFSHGKNVDKVKPINRYNFCGDYLGKKDWEDGDYYDD